jgi:prepilin peptidase CpaA
MSPEVWLAVPLGLAASLEDVVRHRISNWIPATLLAGGVLWQGSQQSWRGAGTALLGAAAGFAIFLVLYLLGKMGGGDVKLMAGFGALLGAGSVLEAAFWTAISGALWAAAYLGLGALGRRGGRKGETAGSVPYAPSITLGAWLALLAKAGGAR